MTRCLIEYLILKSSIYFANILSVLDEKIRKCNYSKKRHWWWLIVYWDTSRVEVSRRWLKKKNVLWVGWSKIEKFFYHSDVLSWRIINVNLSNKFHSWWISVTAKIDIGNKYKVTIILVMASIIQRIFLSSVNCILIVIIFTISRNVRHPLTHDQKNIVRRDQKLGPRADSPSPYESLESDTERHSKRR